MQSALAGKQITVNKVSSKRYVRLIFAWWSYALNYDCPFFVLYRTLSSLGEIAEGKSMMASSSWCFYTHTHLSCLFNSLRHHQNNNSSVNKTVVQASNLSEKLSKAAVTAATTAALFASVRFFFLCSFGLVLRRVVLNNGDKKNTSRFWRRRRGSLSLSSSSLHRARALKVSRGTPPPLPFERPRGKKKKKRWDDDERDLSAIRDERRKEGKSLKIVSLLASL